MIRRVANVIDGFFFARISTRGFGLMRVLWAFTSLLWMGIQWKDVTEFYSDGGVLPTSMEHLILRSQWRFTMLDWITMPDAVMALYVLMMFCLFCMMLGIAPRISTIASVVILSSFHERNPLPFGGGDTVLRVLGVLLVIAPSIDAFSLKRLTRRVDRWHRDGTQLPDDTMSVWPYRLLLWQMLVLYGTSSWFKLMGTMWTSGTAVASALHHPTFSRLPKHVVDLLTPFTPIVTFSAIAWQMTWLLLLIPKPLVNRVIPHGMLKRGILLGGIWFHGSILLMMDAGSFSVAMFAAYAGLLVADDFRAARDCINNQWKRPFAKTFRPEGSVIVLFDGRCAFCQKSIFLLQTLDALRRLRFVNIYDAAKRKEAAPDIALDHLKKAMHVVTPAVGRRKPKAYAGFYGFRQIARHVPAFWIVVPLLYVPGVPLVGSLVYMLIASRRHGGWTPAKA